MESRKMKKNEKKVSTWTERETKTEWEIERNILK